MLEIPSTPDPRRDFALEVVRTLHQSGFQSLWAGGCVRDLLLNREPSDFDVATDAPPEAVLRLFRRTVPVGVSFGVVRVLGPREAGEIEVATFRSDGEYLDGRRPEDVTFGTAEADAARRDFTINGMFYDPIATQVIDYVGGRDDLEQGILRAIGDPAARFAEDKLRLLRAVRFAARFGLSIEPETRRAIGKMAPEVVQVSAERIADELRKMLVAPTRCQAMALAMETGLIAAVLPDLVAMRGLAQDKPVLPGGDLWDHTLLVLDRLPPQPSFALALAALLHDVGKPAARGLKDGRTTFFNHEYVGRRIAETVTRDLKLANADRDRVAWLVESHMILSDPLHLREAKLKRILSTPGIAELLALHRADALATTGDDANVQYCEWYLREQPTGAINPAPLLTGHDLQQHGWKPGPQFKIILEQAYEEQLERRILSKKAACEWLENQKPVP